MKQRAFCRGIISMVFFVSIIGCESTIFENSVSSVNTSDAVMDYEDYTSARSVAERQNAKLSQNRAVVGGLDDVFMNIGLAINGFGGLYLNSDGELEASSANQNVIIDPALTAAVERALLESVLDHGILSPSLDEGVLSGGIRLVPAKFTFIELATWRETIERNAPAGVEIVSTDVDERANVVRIGVLHGTSEVDEEQYLRDFGIPVDAVVFEAQEFGTPTARLDERIRPIAGGLGIQNNGCTLGIPVWYGYPQGGGDPHPDTNPWGFLTAAHCTQYIDFVEPRRMYQYTFLDENDRMGTELREAPLYDCGTPYPCTDADVSLIHLPSEMPLPRPVGKIYLTTALGVQASHTIDQTLLISLDTPTPLVGQAVQKVGVKSAWTEGEVSATCVNTTVGLVWYKDPLGDPDGADVRSYMSTRCHAETTIPVMVGDSGSAIFRNYETGQGAFMGILSYCSGCSGTTASYPSGFATYGNIQNTLGNDVRTRLE